MARPLRPQIQGGLFHVSARGNAGQRIYLTDRDRRRFLKILTEVVERMNLLCHAFCLMGNHYHLLVETPDGNLSTAIKQLNGVYAQYFNRRHTRRGHLFQGRFWSGLVEKEAYLLVVARYIVRNPVRSQLVSHPRDWQWSSYRAQAGLDRPPSFLTLDWLLSSFHATDRGKAYRAFREFVDQAGEDDEDMTARSIVGTSEFVSKFHDVLSKSASIVEIPRSQRLATRPSLSDLFSTIHGKKDRDERARSAYFRHGYNMKEIADHLGVHPVTVSRALRDAST